jgi:hypothetical protein
MRISTKILVRRVKAELGRMPRSEYCLLYGKPSKWGRGPQGIIIYGVESALKEPPEG